MIEEKERKYTNEDLKTMQSWPLERKIQVTQTRIIEFIKKFDDKVYVLSEVIHLDFCDDSISSSIKHIYR